ncbi:aldo/keto reductase [Streptomyces sp. NPDC058217]|uniref:aldo/keto reductase n=1 Tax=Streptomyces sp. NPDC058217 TaxID=3346384 RepID=UPI0036EEEDD1
MGQMQSRPGAWVPVDRPAYLRHQCEMSLRRLGVDRIGLLHLHRVDPDAPFAGRTKSTWSSRKQAARGATSWAQVRVIMELRHSGTDSPH